MGPWERVQNRQSVRRRRERRDGKGEPYHDVGGRSGVWGEEGERTL